MGAYKGWVSVVRGVPGFIWSGDGAGRGRERTQSTQTAKKDVDGEKAARFPPKIAELSENFAEQFRASIIRRGDTLLHLIDHTANLGHRAEAAASSLQKAIDLFPVVSEGLRYTIKAGSRDRPSAPGKLYLALRSQGGGTDSFASLMAIEAGPAMRILIPLIGQSGAEQVLDALNKVQKVSDEMSRLATLTVPFPKSQMGAGQSPLDSWIDCAGTYGNLCAIELASRVSRFEQIDGDLNDHVFEFNAMRQPVRYRSIICRADINQSDPLGPTEPRFRVVTFISRQSGKRNSMPVTAYKAKVAAARVRKALTRTLGESPSAALQDEIAGRRERACSPWITKELISHCYLGKHTVQIMNKQKLIAGAMEQWLSHRQLFQRLLHK